MTIKDLLTGLSAIALLTACVPETPDRTAEPDTGSESESEAQAGTEAPADEPQPVADLRILSADDMEGRLVGSEGNARARAYILDRFAKIGLEPNEGSFEHGFSFSRAVDFTEPAEQRSGEEEDIAAVNLVGRIEGVGGDDAPVMVVGAHYDHVGTTEDGIFNGADDNASGVAGLLAVARHFADNPPEHDVVFVAFDAEEGGLNGARAFVDDQTVPLDAIGFMLNMDMIGYSPDGDLYAVGTWHYPELEPIVEAAAGISAIELATGYDQPTDNPRDDWTFLSDHGPFHAEGIPFLYLGVEDHEHYHQTTDTFENMTIDFFLGAVATAVDVAERVDAELEMIASFEPRERADRTD